MSSSPLANRAPISFMEWKTAAMARIRVNYLVQRPGRNGTPRRYWQPGPTLRAAGWRAVRLADALVKAIAEAEAINGAVALWQKRQPIQLADDHRAKLEAAMPEALLSAPGQPLPTARPSTFAELIRRYRMSDEFRELRRSTRRTYEDNLRALERWGGPAPLEVLTPERFVILWKSLRTSTPTKAKGVITMARILFAWARRHCGYGGYRQDGALIPDNPAAKLNIKTAKPKRTEEDLWSPEEIEIFSAVAEQVGRLSIGIAVELNGWIGQRQGDVLSLSVSQYRNGEIVLRQSKTDAAVALPVSMVPGLAERLAELRHSKSENGVVPATLVFDESCGRSWSANTFRHAFDAVRTEAAKWCPSLGDRQFMLLRHTAIVRLAESGCTAAEISAISGHTLQSVNQILERYLVRTRQLAETAFRKRLSSPSGQKG